MEKFRDLPIEKKISRAILATSISALLICGGTIVTYEFGAFKKAAMESLLSLAEIVGANSTGAIAFNDVDAANQILAGLRERKPITAARIYKDGVPFATYVRPDISSSGVPATTPRDEWQEISNGRLKVFHPIRFREDKIGDIYVESDMVIVYRRLQRYVLIVAIVLALLIPLVFLIARHLQRIISNPIQELAHTAQQVATNRNFSVRVPSYGKDEVGRLTEAFNLMLETIESTTGKLVESNRRMVEQSDELQRSNKELEQFAYISSHDLQEPLRKIATYSQLLELKYKDRLDADADKFIANICTSATRMRTLIQDLLTYSRLTRQKSKPVAIDLNQNIKDVIADMESSIQEKAAKITFDVLPTLQVDAFQMRQLFQNLLGNAIKFHGKDAPCVHVSCELKGQKWLFGVHDNGIGIDKKYTDLIFQVFQRLNGRDAYPGTGIGLAICKKIVEQCGGEIWVESELDRGSHFFFTLPANKTVS